MINKIAIHGVPRSGTSWLGSILDSAPSVNYNHQPLFSYKLKSFLSNTSNRSDIERFFNLLLETSDEFIKQTAQKKDGLIPSFNKKLPTHVAYKEARYHHIIENLLAVDPNIKIIALIRNPKSVLHSWFNAPKEFDKTQWSINEEWLSARHKNAERVEEFYGYAKWKEFAINVLMLQKRYPERVFVINYKELLSKTYEQVDKLFEFCQLEMTLQTIAYISPSNIAENNDPYSVFRKSQTDNKWQNGGLPREIISYIDNDLKGGELERFNM